MPLPFQLNHINLWLLRDGDGWTIVDTGFANDAVRDIWRPADRRAGWSGAAPDRHALPPGSPRPGDLADGTRRVRNCG